MLQIDRPAAAHQFKADVGTGLMEGSHTLGKERTEPGRQRQPDTAAAGAHQRQHCLHGAFDIIAERQQCAAKRGDLDAMRPAHDK
ncbi:hypothetical protein LJN214_002630 [Mesorhizobium sp. LjNodule214]